METVVEEKNSMVDFLTCDGKQIILIGTAHVSRQSAKLVEDTIHEQSPDTICVELCETRLASLKDVDRWRNMDIVKVIKEKKALMLFMNLLLASFQKKMADKFDIKPGQEMINAIKAAEKIKFIFSLIFSFGAADDIKEEDIEKMKQEDILQTILSDVKKTHPIIEKVLINERDQFLAEKIRTAPGEKIVAVVGAAHAPGIKKYLASNDKIDLSELNRIPPAGKTGQILKWLIPAVILFLVAMGFSMKGESIGADMIWVWIIAHSLLAGIGALLALAHPLSILSAVLFAPFSPLNPIIKVGWVSGLVEAFTKNPKVKDLEAIPHDISSIKGFWRNNVTRILLVVVFTNLGSSIGTFTAVPLMLKLFH